MTITGVDQNTLQTYLHQLDQLEQEVLRMEGDLPEPIEQSPYAVSVKMLLTFRGIGLVMALTFYLGAGRRFATPRQLMAYLGMVPNEHSSGAHTQRGQSPRPEHPCAKSFDFGCLELCTRSCSRRVLQPRQQAVTSELIARS